MCSTSHTKPHIGYVVPKIENYPFGTKAPPPRFNEPVRKKHDRENLLAISCKQCQKFYDAIASGDTSHSEIPSCKHDHLQASRHQVKFQPPNILEGFWDLYFLDSIDTIEGKNNVDSSRPK